MSADLMSYMKINDIQNIEDVPDLNQYFDEKATNNLNSCYIKITDYGETEDQSSITYCLSLLNNEFNDRIWLEEKSIELAPEEEVAALKYNL